MWQWLKTDLYCPQNIVFKLYLGKTKPRSSRTVSLRQLSFLSDIFQQNFLGVKCTCIISCGNLHALLKYQQKSQDERGIKWICLPRARQKFNISKIDTEAADTTRFDRSISRRYIDIDISIYRNITIQHLRYYVAPSCVIGDKPFLWSKAKFDPP